LGEEREGGITLIEDYSDKIYSCNILGGEYIFSKIYYNNLLLILNPPSLPRIASFLL